MKSILQTEDRCYLCHRTDNLDTHHVFFGANRKWSEKYGLTVKLCHNSCHIFGKNAAHKNKQTDAMLKDMAQRKFEQMYSHEKFMEVFGRNYLIEHEETIFPWDKS